MEHIRDHVKVAATMGVFLHAVGCWELAKSLAKATARKDSKQAPDPRPSPRDLSLTDSALTRAASRHIGRGASSALLQEFASAAIEESGRDNVSKSTLALHIPNRKLVMYSS